MNRLLLSFCFLSIFAINAIAQPITNSSLDQLLEAAAEAENVGNYAGALDTYQEIYDEMRESKKGKKSNPELLNIALKIGELEFRLRDFARAEKRYARILKKDDENLFADHRYMYGRILKAGAKYSQALEEFNKLISLTDNEELIAAAEFEIEGIEMLRAIEPNVESAIGLLDKSINSRSEEYSPRESGGVLYYGSLNRKTPIEVDSKDEDEYHAKIYMAARNDEGKYEDGEELDQNVNRIGFHNAYVCFSRDGRTMYFTRVQTTGTEITSSQIMVSYKRDTGWSAATPAPGLNGDWFCTQPAVGQLFGKDVLFFVADMDGGLGDYDIYYSNIKGDGSFSAPVNLGEKINTPLRDISPFYYEGTLYYSTEGKPTIGGFDIFYSLWDGSTWSDAENMGLGYNSSCDDLGFYMAEEGGRGYFTSNRPTEDKKKLKSATCCDDIFEFQIREIVIDLLAIVVDEEDTPIDAATIKVENISDPINYPPSVKYNSLGNEFQFLLDSDFKYQASITREGFHSDTIEFNTAGILDNYTVKKKITLKKKVEETVVVTVNEPIRLDNIYYDFDDDKILPDAEDDLEFLYDLMVEYPEMVIELSSHTDAQGYARYNLDLSQRRAESAKKWLENKGVNKKRIVPVGYGEKVILNKCKNRVPCTDDEHRFNRRTEFKIIAGPQSIEITREVK